MPEISPPLWTSFVENTGPTPLARLSTPALPSFLNTLMHKPKMILASESKTRKELLTAAGLTFETMAAPLDEKALHQTLRFLPPKTLSVELAKAKALAVSKIKPEALVVGADQILELEGKAFHRPTSLEDAAHRLKFLRGKNHVLQTSMVCAIAGEVVHSYTESPKITMRPYSDSFVQVYLSQVGPTVLGAAGCYHYEGLGAQLFEKVEGDYYAILGLPLLSLLAFLRQRSIIPA